MDWLHFYQEHRSRILSYGIGFFALVVFCIFYATSGSNARHTAKAQQALEQWKANPFDTTLENTLRASLQKAPHVVRILNPDVAQTLLAIGRTKESESLGASYLARLSEEAPLHAAFATTSFLIEKKEYQKALEQAVALKERLENGSSLYLYNLFRIGCLQKQVGNSPGELAAWEELRGILEAPHAPASSALLKTNFQKQKGQKTFSLTHFLSLREKQLTNTP